MQISLLITSMSDSCQVVTRLLAYNPPPSIPQEEKKKKIVFSSLLEGEKHLQNTSGAELDKLTS